MPLGEVPTTLLWTFASCFFSFSPFLILTALTSITIFHRLLAQPYTPFCILIVLSVGIMPTLPPEILRRIIAELVIPPTRADRKLHQEHLATLMRVSLVCRALLTFLLRAEGAVVS